VGVKSASEYLTNIAILGENDLFDLAMFVSKADNLTNLAFLVCVVERNFQCCDFFTFAIIGEFKALEWVLICKSDNVY
jgi:hypothetical protein